MSENLETDARTIAVVGSGASTQGRKLGAEIDAHDLVIRMHNQQPKKHNTEDLGTKWTWLASALHSKAVQHIEDDTEMIVCIHHSGKYGGRASNAPTRLRDKIQWIPYKYSKSCEYVTGSWPTSGLLLLYWLYMSKLMDRCVIYGIDGYRTGYYGGRGVCTKSHDLAKERQMIDWLSSRAIETR